MGAEFAGHLLRRASLSLAAARTAQPTNGKSRFTAATTSAARTSSYDVWYTQALRVWSDSSGKHHEFYWDLPDTSTVIRVTVAADYGNIYPPSPALTFGDAPWNPSNEIMNGVMRGFQVYSILAHV